MTTQTRSFGLTPMTPDSPIHDCDGKEIGRLKEMTESYFKVNTRMAPDYWLPVHLIERVDGDHIVLSVRDGDLDRHKSDAGAEDLAATDIDDATDDTLHPEPMERRYAAESEYLTHPHPPT